MFASGKILRRCGRSPEKIAICGYELADGKHLVAKRGRGMGLALQYDGGWFPCIDKLLLPPSR